MIPGTKSFPQLPRDKLLILKPVVGLLYLTTRTSKSVLPKELNRETVRNGLGYSAAELLRL